MLVFVLRLILLICYAYRVYNQKYICSWLILMLYWFALQVARCHCSTVIQNFVRSVALSSHYQPVENIFPV